MSSLAHVVVVLVLGIATVARAEPGAPAAAPESLAPAAAALAAGAQAAPPAAAPASAAPAPPAAAAPAAAAVPRVRASHRVDVIAPGERVETVIERLRAVRAGSPAALRQPGEAPARRGPAAGAGSRSPAGPALRRGPAPGMGPGPVPPAPMRR